MNKVDVGAYRIRPECAHLSLCMYSGVCNTPLRLIAGIPSCTLQEAFQPWDSVLHDAGSFPALGFRPARCRKLSSLGIPSCTMQGAFQPWDSVPTLWESFRSLHFRKVSIIGGLGNGLTGKFQQLYYFFPKRIGIVVEKDRWIPSLMRLSKICRISLPRNGKGKLSSSGFMSSFDFRNEAQINIK